MDLIRRIEDGEGEFLLFALTPPRLATDRDRAQEIADTTIARLQPLELDGLILYDIDDEAERNPAERPFPFMPTLDPADYLAEHLGTWEKPVIVYRAVGKYAPEDLRAWLSAQDPARAMTVLVGAASSSSRTRTSLMGAQALRREVNPRLSLGGVAIPERHGRREDEHLRLLAKQDAGCRFFVTQVVYDVNAAKDLVSDYHYECKARGLPRAPFVFTFSVCGSMKTLAFLRWLGSAFRGGSRTTSSMPLIHSRPPTSRRALRRSSSCPIAAPSECRSGSTSRACRSDASRSKPR